MRAYLQLRQEGGVAAPGGALRFVQPGGHRHTLR